MKRFKRFVANELPSLVAGGVLGLVGSVALLLGAIWLAIGTTCSDVQSIKIASSFLSAGCN